MSAEAPKDPRRALPGVDRLAREVRRQRPALPAWAATAAARRVVAEARDRAQAGEAPELAALADRARDAAEALAGPRPRRVVNATGVVLHTNLGRAPLAAEAARIALEAATRYGDLELDVASGRRGDRLGSIGDKLAWLAGTEAAAAVNNAAGALLLAVNTLARGRQVVVSRGELIEIGGSFRLPEILEAAGVELVEVGTTNRTHLDDYRRAIGPDTGLLLKVHRSNFEQTGFTAEVGVPALAELAREAGLPLVEDLGSGTLVDLRRQGLPEESCVPARVRLGADLICFSGDKLMGGPQAGILVGRRALVARLRRNPLARALRLDKVTLAALDATLDPMLAGEARERIPVLRLLTASEEDLEVRARTLAVRLARALGRAEPLPVRATRVPVGGGSLPGRELPSRAVVLHPAAGADALAARLRAAPVPVLARVVEDAVLIDARTLFPDDDAALEDALRALPAGALREPCGDGEAR